jgi:hypothetical protein
MAHTHGELIDALVRGDGRRARELDLHQTDEVGEVIVNTLLASPAVLTAPVSLSVAVGAADAGSG